MIRRAELKDIPALMDIYNDAILHTTATFDTESRITKTVWRGFRRTQDSM